jgi:peptidoglycan/LPS O-acetylase OafA/YrhL
MPAAWAYLAFIFFFCNGIGVRLATWPEVRACLFFYRNFAGTMTYFATRHFWSLSLEEQFYLVWPPVLLLSGVRRGRWIAPAAALAFAAWRGFHWSEYDHIWPAFHTEARADALLIGCTLAFAMASPVSSAALARWARWFAAPAFAALLYCMVRFPLLIPAAESVAIALLIAASVSHSRSAWCAWLDLRPLAFLGRVSYGIYLWQQIAMAFNARLLPWSLGIALPLVVLGSYEYLELPCIRLGQRLAAKMSPRLPRLLEKGVTHAQP